MFFPRLPLFFLGFLEFLPLFPNLIRAALVLAASIFCVVIRMLFFPLFVPRKIKKKGSSPGSTRRYIARNNFRSLEFRSFLLETSFLASPFCPVLFFLGICLFYRLPFYNHGVSYRYSSFRRVASCLRCRMVSFSPFLPFFVVFEICFFFRHFSFTTSFGF